MQEEKRLIPESGVRQRYGGVCASTLYRWDRNPDLNFPKPVVINGRKYRDAAELDAFDNARLSTVEAA